jgi:hypothetical protein
MCWKPALRPLCRCLLAGALGLAALMALTWVLAVSTSVQAGNLASSSGFPPPPSIERQAIGGSPALSPHLGYGLNVRDPANLHSLFAPLGFEWVKLYEQYDALPTERLPYKVLYRIQLNGPPADMQSWGEHVATIARAGRGLVEAYEIGNEPNQSWQWGDQVPDPEEYAAALQVAYARINEVDPDAIVVSAGLGPVGRIEATPGGEGRPGNNGQSMDEWEYARIMFSRCVTGCFDVFGYHPFGFAYPPEIDPDSVPNNFSFRGAEDVRRILVEHGLEQRPMWATEFGWIRDPDADGLGGCKQVPDFNDPFGWMLVSELAQADYVSRAFAYADAHWPWMEAMFVWNLDWNDQGWSCDHVRFFSLRYVGGEATPAYEALAVMDKRPGPGGCRLLARPSGLVFMADEEGAEGISGTVDVADLGGCAAISWTVTLTPSSTLGVHFPITWGRLGQPLRFEVDTGGGERDGVGTVYSYPTGTYTALLRLDTLPEDVIGSPQRVGITLTVAAEVHWLYLPVVVRDEPIASGS